MKTDIKVFYIPDFMVFLKALEKGRLYLNDIMFKTDITYSHLYKLKKMTAEKGWVDVELIGKKHYLSLSEKGKELVNIVNMLLLTLNIDDNKLKDFRQKTKGVDVNVERNEGVQLGNEPQIGEP